MQVNRLCELLTHGISEQFWLGDGNAPLSPVVRKVDNAIHRINLYPVGNAIVLPKRYPLDFDLFGGYRFTFKQPGPGQYFRNEISNIRQSYSLYLLQWNARKTCFLFIFKRQFPETLGIKWEALIVLAVFLAETSEYISLFHERVSLNLENSRFGPTAIR